MNSVNMRNIIAIIKKELSRVFKDKRLVFTTILMPGLMIFLLYSVMGEAMSSITNPTDISQIVIINNDPTFNSMLETSGLKYEIISGDIEKLDEYKQDLYDGNIDYILVFPSDFNQDDNVLYNINTYYNPSNDISSNTNDYINSCLALLEDLIINNRYGNIDVFTINVGNNESMIFDESQMMGLAISMILPFLIITFLFSGAMSVAPEAIAGEKERGTMATLLVTPIKRSEISLGKIISLSIVSVASAISSFIGIIASLPKLLGLNAENGINDLYSIGDYAIILIILIVTVLLIVGLITVVSALAKNMKEANTFILPLYLIVMGVGVSTMFSTTAQINSVYYFIPIYNSLQCLVGVFTFDYNVINLLITIIVNICFTGIFTFILTKLFNSEKVMFAK